MPTAESPFDNPTHDAIIRSSNGTDFMIHRLMLSLASPVFQTMFSLPQNTDMKAKIPIAVVVETEETLRPLFLMCYPRSTEHLPIIPSLEAFQDIVKAASKYFMADVITLLEDLLMDSSYFVESPVRIYSIAIIHSLPRLARAAAKCSLRIPFAGRSYYPEMDVVSISTNHRLEAYHNDCAKTVKSTVDEYSLSCSYSTSYSTVAPWLHSKKFSWASGRYCGQNRCEKKNLFRQVLTKFSAIVAVTPMFADIWRTFIPLLEEGDNSQHEQCKACRKKMIVNVAIFLPLLQVEIERVVSTVSVVTFNAYGGVSLN